MGWEDAPLVEEKPAWETAPLAEPHMPEYAPPKETMLEKGKRYLGQAGKVQQEIAGSIAEPIFQLASGMVAKPVSEIAGLAATGYEMATGGEGAQAIPGFQKEVQERLTYQPRTASGQSPYNPLNLIPLALGKAVGLVTPEKAAEGESLTAEGVLRNVASEAVPQALGFAGMKAAPKASIPVQKAAKTLRSGAEDLMQSALKPTAKDLLSGDAAKAIDTMLEKGISATPKGIDKIRARIDELNKQIRDAIANSPERVETAKLARPVVEKLRDFRKQVNPNADINAIKSSWAEFKNHPLLQHVTPAQTIPKVVDPYTGATTPAKVIPARGKEDMAVQTAQELKQGTYKQLAKKYGQLGSADVEAQKAIARGLKEQVAEKVPAISPLNLEESKLFNVLDVAERRIVMEANKNPMGLSLLAKNPKAWAAFMADRSATAKSLLAHIMNKASQKLTGTGSNKTAQRAMETAAAITPAQTEKERKPKPLAEAFQ